MFLLSSSMYSQEIGNVTNGGYSISLIKTTNDKFACMYSDVGTNKLFPERVFIFPNKETVYTIIMDGFKNENNHQVYVQIEKNSIIKFEYKRMDGVMLVKINHNNLYNNSIGNTLFLTKNEIDKLFGKLVGNKV